MSLTKPVAEVLQAVAAFADQQRIDQSHTSLRELELQLLQAKSCEHKPKPAVTAKEPPDLTSAEVSSNHPLNRYAIWPTCDLTIDALQSPDLAG